MGEVVIQVRFDYARSASGQPVAVLPVDEDVAVDWVICETVKLLEAKGHGYHGCQAMPSLDAEDYVLEVDGKVVVSLRDLRLGTKGEFPYTRSVNLVYVGEFGDFQRGQAVRLGGQESLRIAEEHCRRGRGLTRLEES